MLRQSIRSSKSLALSLALGVVAAAGVTGCGASDAETDDVVVAPEVQSRRIDASAFERIQPGQLLDLDMITSKVVYHVDYSTPIDYARVNLVFGNNSSVNLATQVAAVEQGTYGYNPQPDLHSNHDSRFKIAADPSYFGQLTESQLAQLKVDGYFYSDTPKAPEASPQSTDDDCIHAVCDVCVDNETGGHPVSWLPGTFTCYEIEHVWCD